MISPKKTILALLFLCFSLVACEQNDSVNAPGESIEPTNAGEIHNRILQNIFDILDAEVEKGELPTRAQRNRASLVAVNELLEPSGTMLNIEQVDEIIENGLKRARKMAADPEPELQLFALEVFGSSCDCLFSGRRSSEFFNRYVQVRIASIHNGVEARAAFKQVCEELGAPIPGSKLEVVLDIMVCSDEFWSQRYPQACAGDLEKFWGGVARFVCLAAIDAGTGFLAGAGYGSIGGPGGCAAGATIGLVVGILTSVGAGSV